MIPIKLALRNFMCYRDNVPPLQFAGIHTASISGDNGNGKSALIDAMTWALWGKARAKSDDDLIHSNQTEMEVEFDFAVGQQSYRIIRKHAKAKSRRASGQTILEFQIATDNGFRPISGNSIRETQEEIIRRLHMDYETFINSALLLQGRADEFTKANPARRKEVLADILELYVYDELEEQAKGLVKKQETTRTQLENTIQDINHELVQKPAYEQELQQAQSELSRAEIIIKETESRLNELRQKKELLGMKQTQLAQLEKHLTETSRTLELLDNQLKQRQTQIKEYEELIARSADIEEGYSKFITAKKLHEELNHKLTLINRLNQQKYELDTAIRQAQATLVTEHKLAETKIMELEADSQKLPRLRNDLQQTQDQLQQLAGQEEILKQKRQTFQELLTHAHGLEASQSRLGQEMAEVEEKLHLLFTESGAKCPLCETELGTEGIKLIETKYTAEKQSKSEFLKATQSELAEKKIAYDQLEKETSRLEIGLNRDKTSAQSTVNLIRQQIEEAEKASHQLNEARTRLAEIEEQMTMKKFAAAEQEALRQLEEELARLDYNSAEHEKIRQQLAGLEHYGEPRRKLEESQERIAQVSADASQTEKTAQELRRSREADQQHKEGLSLELQSLPRIENDFVRVDAEHQELAQQQRHAQEVIGSIKAKLERCTEMETRKREREKLLSQASREEKIYRDLAQAFGKRGIQAWLIEMVFPEIEAETNKLLGRMTDNRMHVKIEAQRETRKGDVLETLDIRIEDELGMRNYEMFSGGEAFRINFAIRIALSKLLARRAGAPLPTVIIDEGFGTQDSTGLEKIKEAITSIQDDFEMILVITHIDELRDAFPTHIDVVKTAEGSTIEVS
ncbi:AAA family ATPase [Chloroflexota bacterium]